MLTLSQRIDDEGEDDESKEEHVEFLEAREDAAASLQSTPHPRACGAPFVQLTVIRPRSHPAPPRRPHGHIPQCHGQGPRLGARGRPVPQHRGRSGGRAPARQQLAARRGGGGGPGRECADERRAIVRGTPRHRGGPPASGAAEGWRTGCVRAPGPAGGTWTRGRASDRAARGRRPLGSRCRCAQTRASPPGCDPRGSRGERGGPGATSGRQPAPCAALRGDRPEGGEHGARGEADRAARHRERGRAPGVWSLRGFHTSRIP